MSPSFSDDQTRLSATGLVEQFVKDWAVDSPPNIADYLPDDRPRETIVELVVADLERRWPADRGKTIEQYLEEFPELGPIESLDEAILLAELEARRPTPHRITLSQLAERFPEQAKRWAIADTQEAEELGPNESRSTELTAGDEIDGFRIETLLGEGSLAKVYLAEELALGRRVALKVSRDASDEERLMARLEHPNIVPIYSQRVHEGRKLIAMRYVRGATLASWMSNLSDVERRTWRGIELTLWLREVAQTTADDAAGKVMDRRRFDRQGFVPIVCRLILDIARGLQHAHQNNVLHGDVKPANIMLDVDGRAMLMDFNVSSEQLDTGAIPLGGTLAYMSPEQLRMVIPGEAQQLIDGRSDLYALGVLFYELLTGEHPWSLDDDAPPATRFEAALARRLMGAPQIPSQRKRISIGLGRIVSKCLEPQLENRYGSAQELIEDLERHLSHRPLKFTEDPSWLERSAKWTKRHPRIIASAITTTVVMVLAGASADLNRTWRAERALAECREDLAAEKNTAGAKLSSAHQLLSQENWVLPNSWLHAKHNNDELERLAKEIAPLERERFARNTDDSRASRTIATQLKRQSPLDVYGVLQRPDWESLPQIKALDPIARISVFRDITELLVLRAIYGSAGGDGWKRMPMAYRSLPLLVRMKQSPLFKRRQKAADSRTLVERLVVEPMTSFERYLVGVVAASAGNDELAIAQLSVTANSEKGATLYWSRFIRAFCLARQGKHRQAIIDYTFCSGLRPASAWPNHNIGLIEAKDENFAAAIRNFKRAIAIDDTLVVAQMNLGVVYMLQDKPQDALRAFDAAVKQGPPPAQLLANRAAALARLKRYKEARRDLREALKLEPENVQAKTSLRQLEGIEKGGQP